MTSVFKAALVGAAFAVAGIAPAAATTIGPIDDRVNGSEIDDYYFSVSQEGLVTIDVVERFGEGDNCSSGAYWWNRACTPEQVSLGSFDTEINLFRDDGDLTLDDFIENDDDGGTGLESMISRVLSAGNYLLRIGNWNFGNSDGTDPEIIAATNPDSNDSYYTLTISGEYVTSDRQEVPETAPVPLPAAGWMLLAGVGGLAAMRRRAKSRG